MTKNNLLSGLVVLFLLPTPLLAEEQHQAMDQRAMGMMMSDDSMAAMHESMADLKASMAEMHASEGDDPKLRMMERHMDQMTRHMEMMMDAMEGKKVVRHDHRKMK